MLLGNQEGESAESFLINWSLKRQTVSHLLQRGELDKLKGF